MAITPQLTQYVNQARQSGMSDEQIRQELTKTGWGQPDIDAVLPPNTPIPPIPVLQKPFQDQNTAVMNNPMPGSQPRGHKTLLLIIAVLLVIGGAVYYFLPQIITLYDQYLGNEDVLEPVTDANIAGFIPEPVDVTANAVICEDGACFAPYYAACVPTAMFRDKQQKETVEYEIKEKTDFSCKVSIKYTEHQDPRWMNQGMVCTFNNSLGFEDALIDVYAGAYSGAADCVGELYTVLSESVK